MNKKIIYIMALCLMGALQFNNSILAQIKQRVMVTRLPENTGKQGESRFYDVEPVLEGFNMIMSTDDYIISLYDDDNNPISQDDLKEVSLITFSSGDAGGFNDITAGNIIFQTFSDDGGLKWFIKKVVAMEIDQLFQLMNQQILEIGNPTFHNLSSVGYVNDKKYIVNFKLALQKVTIYNQGTTRYLAVKNFSLVPEDNNPNDPPWSSLYTGIVRFYFTFENLNTGALVKYPEYKMNWSQLTSNTSRIFKLPSDLDDVLFNGSYTPVVTMLVYKRNFLTGNETFLSRFDFNLGTIDGIPRSPALNIQENEFSLTLNWSADAFATSYAIYRAESPMDDITLLTPMASATTTNFEDTNIIPGKRYFYQVLPVRSDGMEGIASNEASGMASSPVILTLDNPNNQSYPKGGSFIISGTVLSAKSQTPLTDAKVNAYVEELSFANNDVLTSSTGEFQLIAEVPAVAGAYNYIVQTQYNTEGEGLEFMLNAQEDPSKGHELELYNASSGALFKQPGQSINTTYSLKNWGLVQETGSVEMEIFDDENNTVSGIIPDPFTLATGSIKNGNISYTLPTTLTNGNYYAEIRCGNELDEHRINNIQRTTFFVSNITNPPAYRLGAYQFDSVSHSRSIDGRTVTLVSATSTTASFSVNGEVTGALEAGDYWFNNAETFALHIVDVSYFSYNFLDVDIRAGASNSSYTHSPYFNVFRKDEPATTLITAPSGSQLNNEVNFILDIDSIILQTWLQTVIHPNNQSNKLELTFDVPGSEDSRTYYAYTKTTDNNYWWIKRLYLTPIKKRNISKTGALTITNITANGNPGNLTGDQFEVSGSFKNNGDFDENTLIKFCLIDENDSIWFDHDTLEISVGGQSNFSFTFPSLGMEAKNYTIEVIAAQPEDTDLSDNKFTANLLLEEVLEADCYFEDFNSYYEAGDTINAAVHVEHLGTTITEANVLLEITNPGGQKRMMPAYFDASSQSYRADYVTDLSGNYYFTTTTSAKRYLNASAEAIAKVKVYLTLENKGNTLYKGSPVEYELTTGNVGGVYAFAGHMEFNDALYPLAAYEGNLINPGQSTQSTLSFSSSSSALELGITRLEPSAPNYSAFEQHTICLITMLCSESGDVYLSMPAYTLYDAHGEPMVAELQINPSSVIEHELFLRFMPNDTIYTHGDTLSLVTSILGKSNMAGVSFDLNYNDTLLDYLGTAFHQSLGEYEEVSLIQQADDNGNGRITLGSVRSDATKIGCDYSVIKIAETKFIVKNAGPVHFTPENIHLYSPYEGVEFSYTLESDSAIALPFDPNSLAFSPDTLSIWPSQTGCSQFNISWIKNVFAVSLELSFDTSCVRIDSITEGNLLNFDNQPTSFEYLVDSIKGKIYVGLTRMNNLAGGVYTDTSRTLFNLKVEKKDYASSIIETSKVKIIDPLGNQYTNSFGPHLVIDSLHMHEQEIILATGWNLASWNLSPTLFDIQGILQPLITSNQLTKVIDQNGDIIQQMPWGWVNNIGDMSNAEGYQIKVTEPCTLTTAGFIVALPMDIPLNNGWNLMGWPAQLSEDAEIVFAALIGNSQLEKVIDQSGNILQHMPWGWVNNIGNLSPGQGYQVKVNSNCTLTINDPAGDHIANPIERLPTIFLHSQEKGNPFNPMAFVLRNNNVLPIGAEIGIYNENECFGAAVVSEEYIYLSAGMDEAETPEKEGLKAGSNFHFRYITEEMEQAEKLEVSYLQGDKTFIERGTFVGEIKSTTATETIPNTSGWFGEARPNPTRDEVFVDVFLHEASNLHFILMDSRGKIVMERSIEKPSGMHEQSIDLSKLLPGMYFLKMQMENQSGYLEKVVRIVRI